MRYGTVKSALIQWCDGVTTVAGCVVDEYAEGKEHVGVGVGEYCDNNSTRYMVEVCAPRSASGCTKPRYKPQWYNL